MINEKITNKFFDSKTYNNKNIYTKINNKHKNIYIKPKERLYQYPQVINNYDVNVKVNIKKLNDNNINIETMNIYDLLGKNLEYNNNRNKNIFNEKKDYFSKTDNNIKFLEPILNKKSTKKEGLYNNIITDLKNEFEEIKKKHEMNKENKQIKKDNIRNALFNENNITNNKKELINNDEKKYNWNHKSVNNSFKKNRKKIISQTVTQDLINEKNITYNNNEYNAIKYSEKNKENKNKTQNNFYKIPNDYINLDTEKINKKVQINYEEKLQEDNKPNLQKAITYINNKKTKNFLKKGLNLTKDFININSNINNDNSFINLNGDNDEYSLTLKNNDAIKKKHSYANINRNSNIIKNYISSLNNKKEVINKCNSYISNKKNNSTFGDTQKYINKMLDIENEFNKINKNFTKVFSSKENNSKEKIKRKNSKLLYLDKRINKIKNKMFNNEYNNNINQTEIKNNIKAEKIISFSIINKYINKSNEKNEFNLSIINKITKIQNNIILELKQSQNILKNKLIKKYEEIKNYKNICLKLMWFIKDILFKNNLKNKKLHTIQNQIIKENKILRKLFINKPVNRNSTNHNIRTINSLIQQKSFFNIHYKSKDKANTEHSSDNGRMNTFENNDNDKKRNKSYERINDKYSEILITKNIKKLNENKNSNFKYIKLREKNHKYIGENDDIINIKPGKKIKYLVKDKNNLSLEFENICHNNNI